MGLFSRKTITTVGSTVYNLAGDLDLRPDVMQGTIISHVLQGKDSFSDTLVNSLTSGNSARQMGFHKWAKNNYHYGIPSGSIGAALQVDKATVEAGLTPLLSLTADQFLQVDEAVVDDADAGFWVEDWMEKNHPTLSEDQYTYFYDEDTDEIVVEIDDIGFERIPATGDLIWGSDRTKVRKLLYVTYRIGTKDPAGITYSTSTPYTYRLGSGNVTFDNLDVSEQGVGEFFPAIPLRIKRNMITSDKYSAAYPSVRRAYTKLTGGRIEDVIDAINDHDDKSDMDYVFVVPGVTLNTKDQVAREYLYRFFEEMRQYQRNDKDDFDTYAAYLRGLGTEQIPHERWVSGYGLGNHPLNGAAEPAKPGIPGSPTLSEIQIRMSNLSSWNQKLTWAYVHESIHKGNAKTYDGDTSRKKLKTGSYWMDLGRPYKLEYRRYWKDEEGEDHSKLYSVNYSRVFLFKQIDKYTYKKLEVCGLVHTNYVYKYHAEHVSGETALKDDDETSFLIPLHEPTLRSMGPIKGNQLATANTYLVINAYERRKQKWYETGLFRVVLFVAAIALSVITAGGSLAAAGGLLGSNAALSVFLGFTAGSTAGLVAAAVVNQLAAMVVASLIMKASVSLFGEKIGAIIGTLASLALFAGLSGMASGDTFMSGIRNLLQPEQLIKLTQATTNAYTKWLSADTSEIYDDISDMAETYSEKSEELADMSKELMGMTSTPLDAMMFADTQEYLVESQDTFLSRTLLTASDMHEMSEFLIDRFSEISLELPDPIHN